MAKNRKKKTNRQAPVSMEISKPIVSNAPQGMDMYEIVIPPNSSSTTQTMKAKKGRPMKRSKNVRKKLAIERAISNIEIKSEKIVKNKTRSTKRQSAKTLYE